MHNLSWCIILSSSIFVTCSCLCELTLHWSISGQTLWPWSVVFRDYKTELIPLFLCYCFFHTWTEHNSLPFVMHDLSTISSLSPSIFVTFLHLWTHLTLVYFRWSKSCISHWVGWSNMWSTSARWLQGYYQTRCDPRCCLFKNVIIVLQFVVILVLLYKLWWPLLVSLELVYHDVCETFYGCGCLWRVGW
jgi:hypothetical protein